MKKLLALALVMVLALSLLTACGGGGGNSSTPSGGNNSTSTPPASNTPSTTPSGNDTPGGNNNGTTNDSLFDIPKDEVSGDEAAIAEIPDEMFKGVGKLSYCMVMSSGALEGYKYTLSINLTTSDGKGEAALETLIDYYKSIGATVEEVNEALTKYNVKFDYAQSVSVSATSSGIQLQFSVVKK